jgi:uncharacterized damage-inducible protein DinB
MFNRCILIHTGSSLPTAARLNDNGVNGGFMIHPMVKQLRFTRSEWQRALAGLSNEDARRRLMPMNSISWMVGHLAWQEQRYWLQFAQGLELVPELNNLVASGKPPTRPTLQEMWDAWQTVTDASNAYLDSLTVEKLQTYLDWKGRPVRESVGTLLQRVTYHYWYHTGEALAARQMMGHENLPEFVGAIGREAPYTPE